MGGVADFLSGGDLAQAGVQQGVDQYRQAMEQGRAGLEPFRQAGAGVLPEYQQAIEGMKDPAQFINQLMGQYQESPYAQFVTKQGQQAANQAAAASGMLGSTAEQQKATQFAEDVAGKDLQDYLNRTLGVQQGYLGGLSGLSQMGLSAAGSEANLAEALAKAQLQAQEDIGASKQQSKQGLMQGLSQLGGSIFAL